MKKITKETIIRIVMLIIAVVLIAFFAAYIYVANIGSDAVLVFEQGLAILMNIEIGGAILLANFILAIVLFFFDKKKIHLGTIVVTLLLGPLLQIIATSPLVISPNGDLLQAIIIDIIAITGVAFGLALYINADIGYAPFEGLLITLQEKTSWRFAYIKIVNDIILFVIGYLLGGVVGIGSLLTIIMLGPLIDLFSNLLAKIRWLPTRKKQNKNKIIEEK